MLFGHLAVSALFHRYLNVELSTTTLAGVFPDIVDKTLYQGLHFTSSSRTYSHTLFGLMVTTLGIYLLLGRRKAMAWAIGYFGHLLGDSGGFVPWFYPFMAYHFPSSKHPFRAKFSTIFGKDRWVEWGLLIWAIWALTLGKTRPPS